MNEKKKLIKRKKDLKIENEIKWKKDRFENNSKCLIIQKFDQSVFAATIYAVKAPHNDFE